MAQQMLEDLPRLPFQHPRLFHYRSGQADSEEMPTDIEAGTAPDVFAGCCASFPPGRRQGYRPRPGPYVEARSRPGQPSTTGIRPSTRPCSPGTVSSSGCPSITGRWRCTSTRTSSTGTGSSYPTDAWDHDDYLRAMRVLTHDTNGDGELDLWGSMLDIALGPHPGARQRLGGAVRRPGGPSRCAGRTGGAGCDGVDTRPGCGTTG